MNLIPPNDSRIWDFIPYVLATLAFWAACNSPWIYESKPTAGDIYNWLGIIASIFVGIQAKGFLAPNCKVEK